MIPLIVSTIALSLTMVALGLIAAQAKAGIMMSKSIESLKYRAVQLDRLTVRVARLEQEGKS